jgi:hypothetical protein
MTTRRQPPHPRAHARSPVLNGSSSMLANGADGFCRAAAPASGKLGASAIATCVLVIVSVGALGEEGGWVSRERESFARRVGIAVVCSGVISMVRVAYRCCRRGAKYQVPNLTRLYICRVVCHTHCAVGSPFPSVLGLSGGPWSKRTMGTTRAARGSAIDACRGPCLLSACEIRIHHAHSATRRHRSRAVESPTSDTTANRGLVRANV